MFDKDSPENWDLVLVPVRLWTYDEKLNEVVLSETEVTVHREEQTDLGAIRDALNRSDVEDIELI